MSGFTDWTALTPESVRAELPHLLAEAEKGVAAVEESAPRDFESLEWAVGDAVRPAMMLWHEASHLFSTMNSDEWRKVEAEFQPKMVEFSLRMGQSRKLYDATKAVLAAGGDSLGPVRRRILERSLLGAEQAGVGLDGAAKERFNAIAAEIAETSTAFYHAVLDATKAFSFEKDGKTYTIDDANYPETMKHCADREVREKLYRARSTRAPENTPRIARLLALRREQAALLGYADYAELSLADKSAPSVGAVFAMIDELDAATVAPAADEERELAQSVAGTPLADLAPWDRSFAAERLRERKYAYSETELKRHFELEDVLKGLFRITETLFGVKVSEMSGADKPSVWHPDVRFFRVEENGEAIAHFYFDPFVRNGLKRGGAWMNEFANRCDRRGEKPVAVVVTNFPERDADGRCLLPFREVETLFHEFGHALQCMLTREGEEGAAGINLVEWDAVEVASQFMENWCLDDRTGIEVPEELKRKVRAAKNYRSGSACRRQLAFSKTDMVLHRGDAATDPNEVKNGIFAHFGVPMLPDDLFLNAFTHIFAGGYAAGYYGYKWAEVMSADCYGAFEEAGLGDDRRVREVGARYRDTILAEGGGRRATEVFRSFRGRDPEIGAMLRQQDLLPRK